MNAKQLYFVFAVLTVIVMTGCAGSPSNPTSNNGGCAERNADGWPLVKVETTQNGIVCTWSLYEKKTIETSTNPTQTSNNVVSNGTNGNTCSGNTAILAGGRLLVDNHPETGYEYVGTIDQSWLKEGAPMQPYYHQVASSNLNNAGGVTVPSNQEIVNDGMQFILVCNGNSWKAYKMPADGTVPFWSISFIRLTNTGLQICTDDTGQPGTYDGNCGGKQVVISESLTLDQIQNDADFAPYWVYIQNMFTNNLTAPENGKITINILFHKNK